MSCVEVLLWTVWSLEFESVMRMMRFQGAYNSVRGISELVGSSSRDCNVVLFSRRGQRVAKPVYERHSARIHKLSVDRYFSRFKYLQESGQDIR